MKKSFKTNVVFLDKIKGSLKDSEHILLHLSKMFFRLKNVNDNSFF